MPLYKYQLSDETIEIIANNHLFEIQDKIIERSLDFASLDELEAFIHKLPEQFEAVTSDGGVNENEEDLSWYVVYVSLKVAEIREMTMAEYDKILSLV